MTDGFLLPSAFLLTAYFFEGRVLWVLARDTDARHYASSSEYYRKPCLGERRLEASESVNVSDFPAARQSSKASVTTSF